MCNNTKCNEKLYIYKKEPAGKSTLCDTTIASHFVECSAHRNDMKSLLFFSLEL